MKVYAALNAVPDYSAGPPALVSIHETKDGAAKALYPDNEHFQKQFVFSHHAFLGRCWYGPDGFGMVRQMEVQP